MSKHELDTGDGGFNKKAKLNDSAINTNDLDLFLKDISVPLVSSIEGTPELDDIIGGGATSSGTTNKQHSTLSTKRETPIDIVKAKEYLQERYETLREVNLSNLLLEKKREEDDGIESDTSEEDSEEDGDSDAQSDEDEPPKDFEDLLELFDINPDEMSLDMTLNEKRKLLIDSMDEKQLNRYEFFRRTNLNIGGIKKLINSITGVSVPNDFAKLLGGVGKVFVGDIVEMAKTVQREENEARVGQQIRYKEALLAFEKGQPDKDGKRVKRPEPPSFYDSLLQAETGASLVNIRRRVDTYDNFRVVIPREEAQLTPDHVREAWRRLGHVQQPHLPIWRRGGARSGGLF